MLCTTFRVGFCRVVMKCRTMVTPTAAATVQPGWDNLCVSLMAGPWWLCWLSHYLDRSSVWSCSAQGNLSGAGIPAGTRIFTWI